MSSRPVIQTLDLQEQGEYPLIVFPPPEMADKGVGVVGVDRFVPGEWACTGYRGPNVVIVVPTHTSWVVYSTTLIRLLSREEAMREVATEAKAHVLLAKELYGEEKDITDIMQHMSDAAKTLKPDGTGQYL